MSAAPQTPLPPALLSPLLDPPSTMSRLASPEAMSLAPNAQVDASGTDHAPRPALASASAQDHDREDTPMTDPSLLPHLQESTQPLFDAEQPVNPHLVRLNSNGSSIAFNNESAWNPRQDQDHLMSDDSQNADGSNQLLPPPPPQIARYEDQDDTGHGRSWVSIPEDTSTATDDELKMIEASGEISAIDYSHWEKTCFVDLDDKDYSPIASTRIDWNIDRFNGTKDSPNNDLVMHSPVVELAGLKWRIKLYPKGNDTEYISVYLECVDLLSEGKEGAQQTFADGGTREYLAEPLQLALPITGNKPLRRPRRIPAQVLISVYNPEEPRVNYHRNTSHSFCAGRPDAGFTRFGPASIWCLGTRVPDQRVALLRNDRLAFSAYIRLFSDPTGYLFHGDVIDNSEDMTEEFELTGMNGLVSDNPMMRTRYPSLTSALAVWTLLVPLRKILYAVDTGFTRESTQVVPKIKKPLIHALHRLLYNIRTPGREAYECTEVVDALATYGCVVYRHYDVVQMWDMVGNILEKELVGTGLSFKSLFEPNGFRCKIDLGKNHNVRAGVKSLMEKGLFADGAFPKLLQVELPRHQFDHHSRKWTRSTERISINETMRLTKDSSGAYKLYGLVTQSEVDAYIEYTAVVRPNGRVWYQFEDDHPEDLWVLPLTQKQALVDKEATVYLAIYVRSDVASQEMFADSKTYQGVPEAELENPAYWEEVEEPSNSDHELIEEKAATKTQVTEHRTSLEDAEMTDADGDKDNAQARKDGNMAESQKTAVKVKLFDAKAQEIIELDTLHLLTKRPVGEQILAATLPALSGLSLKKMTLARQIGLHIVEPINKQNATLEQILLPAAKETTIIVSPALSREMSDRLAVEGSLTDCSSFLQYLCDRDNHPELFPGSEVELVEDYFPQEYHRGTFSRGCYHGKGQHIYWNGDQYNGDFMMGERHGRGFQTFHNGNTYDGEWKHGEMHGEGTLTYAKTGNTYQGRFKDGKQHAPGTTTWRVSESNSRTCQVCFEEASNAAFVDCGHVCACLECARMMDTCPMCRKPILRAMRLYFMTD